MSSELEFLNNLWGLGINRVGIGLSYRPAGLHRLAELIPIPGLLKSSNIRALIFQKGKKEIWMTDNENAPFAGARGKAKAGHQRKNLKLAFSADQASRDVGVGGSLCVS